ncbi:MAG: UDP-N-acetylmuramoyl-L-alanyl-D-glutamate--2,6-diaminopimelate ligase [Nitrospirota bacterium]
MILKDIIRDCGDVAASKDLPEISDLDISGVAYDSRKVKEGYLFVAIQGEKFDGHDFIEEALKKGAIAIVHEKPINIKSFVNNHRSLKRTLGNGHSSLVRIGDQCPVTNAPLFIKVKDSRKVLACIAGNFFGRPSENLILIGITGTNGKTTTSYILKSILEAWGKSVGLIGTIQHMIKDRVFPAMHTTPESLEMQRLLSDMLSQGCSHIVSEVSSHALSQDRISGVSFCSAVFTNLTRDHLDFHKTMENYFSAKKKLFLEHLGKNGTAVINIDDQYGKRLISDIRAANSGTKMITTYGLESAADITAENISNTFEGLRFKVSFRDKVCEVSSTLPGMPNVYNIMSAIGASLSVGVPWQAIIEGIRKADYIKGRFEKVDLGQEFLCIVDYAHTDDALQRLIYTARNLLKSGVRSEEPPFPPGSSPRIITVFGCGGNRDPGKRPRMGAVATGLSDSVIITSDNPRNENPLDIIREIELGAVNQNYIVEPDRREAIRTAVDMALAGDIILVAGKGHEDYQEIKGIRHKFSDRRVLEEIIGERLKIQR